MCSMSESSVVIDAFNIRMIITLGIGERLGINFFQFMIVPKFLSELSLTYTDRVASNLSPRLSPLSLLDFWLIQFPKLACS